MQINISTRHGDLSDAAKQKIIDKVEKLSRFVERVSRIDVTVELEKPDTPAVDIIVTTEFKRDFQASYSSSELYGCIDQIVDKIQQQMKKFKEKLTDHR
ncbi:MAG: ribosome hibernation-promoting factor, HPF/YfiA family [Thermoguttaceae bacterium]|jgi:putative sigma-54 modulation protein